MKRNVNVFLAVVLVAMLCGGIIWLRTAKDEKLGWNIHDTYGEAPAYANSGAAYTNATFAGPSNDSGVMRMSPSRTMRHSAVSLHAGAYAISYGVTPASSPIAYSQSPIANSLTASSPSGAGLYTTSSKTFNSYGGGGNGGAAMSYSQSPISNSQSPIANLQSPIANLQSPIAYSTARRSEMSDGAGVNPAMMAAENPVMAMTNAASAGMDNGFYGGYTAMDYSGSANYGQYSGMFGGGSRMGVRGRQNTGSPTFGEDAWWVWLDNWAKTSGYGQGGDADGDGYADGGYLLDEAQINEAYEEFLKGWDYEIGNPPSPQQWWDWYYSYMYAHGGEYWYNGHRYFWTPVGDILPLLLIALLYMLFVVIKSKSLKSLLKTGRSE